MIGYPLQVDIIKKSSGIRMPNKKVTLVWPLYMAPNYDNVQPNISIALLSKVLEEKGIEVDCIDCNVLFYKVWNKREILLEDCKKILLDFVKEIEKTNPAVVGIGSWTHLTPFVIELARLYKARNPNTFIVLGGYNPTLMPDETLFIAPFVDCLIRGEGEYVLLDLIKALDSGKNWRKILGVSYLKDGKIYNNPLRAPIKKLDELPMIDFENFVHFELPQSFYLMASRSCPYSCSFCSVQASLGYYRPHSPNYVLKQIKHLQRLYGMKYFSFEDDDFLANKERAMKIARILEKEKDIYPAAAGRSDEITVELVRALKRAKFGDINMGVESVVPKTLKFLNKSEDPESYMQKTRKSIQILKDEGMGYGMFFIIGAPVEKRQDMEKTLEFMEDNINYASRIELSHVKVHPGAPLWEKYMGHEIELFRAYDPFSPFECGYEHLIWMVPDIYLIRNPNYPNDEYIKLMGEMMARYYNLKR